MKKFLSRKTFILFGLLFGSLLLQLNSCRKSDVVFDRGPMFSIPNGWPAPVYDFTENPLNEDVFQLGRKIFYDERLSINNSVSCGTCHQQFAAFSQIDHAVSHGIFDSVGVRNSPGIFNLAWMTSFFWDGGVAHIEQQPINPIINPVEMGETLENVIHKLANAQDYQPMFTSAFGDSEVTTQRVFKALAQFMGTMVSANAKYDKFKNGQVQLSADEMAGMQIFEENCNSCHKAPLFTDFSFRSNGLTIIPGANGYIDSGRSHITPDDTLSTYTFKVPSLRNLKYTKPYMHDGRFTTLDAVLDHYAAIDSLSVNLHPDLKNGIQLNASQRAQLLAFLNTLNDESFVRDKRFSDPG